MKNEGAAIWVLGLSGSGKTTLGQAIKPLIEKQGLAAIIVDGDELRASLSIDLGFSTMDREENMRRAAAVATIIANGGAYAICCLMSPLRAGVERARQVIGPHRFLEVFIDTPLALCELRDSKGLYKLARTGRIRDLSGLGSTFERPPNPDVTIHPGLEVQTAAERVTSALRRRGLFPACSGRTSLGDADV